MDEAGIRRALISQCKKWSCERQWMCVDTRLEDVLRYTESSPRFVGLAGYNPFEIGESLREIEFAVSAHAFRGVYLHAASFRLPLTDPRMYPLFAKAAELAVPVLLQLPIGVDVYSEINRLTGNFSSLALVLAQSCPHWDQIAAIAAECENVFFALDPTSFSFEFQQQGVDGLRSTVDSLKLKLESSELLGVFQERCMWGSNGMAWPDAVRAAVSFPLPPETRERFLRHNAERVFALDQPQASRLPRSAHSEILTAER